MAIRARLTREMTQSAQAPPPPPPPAAPDRPIDVEDATLERFLQAHETVVVDCWAPWCGPCRIVGPIIDDLAREMQGRVTFAKLNVDNNQRTAQAFGVQSIPTLLVFRRGRLLDRIVGALPKPQLAQHIERLLGRSSGRPGPRRI